MSRAAFLFSLFALTATGCGSTFPEGYHEVCTTSSDCTGGLQCLEYFGPDGASDTDEVGELVCTAECQTEADCPVVRSSHCGDQTVCADGVCGFWWCD